MSSAQVDRSDQVRTAFDAVAAAVREMTPVGAKNTPVIASKSIPTFNMLARPHRHNNCNICKLFGHQSASINQASACRAAIMATVTFWNEMAGHVSTLYSLHEPFYAAVNANKPTYEMHSDDYPPLGKSFEEIFVNRLTCNYLKFVSHYAGVRPKAMVILTEADVKMVEAVMAKLNDFLLKGRSLSDLFDESVAAKEQ